MTFYLTLCLQPIVQVSECDGVPWRGPGRTVKRSGENHEHRLQTSYVSVGRVVLPALTAMGILHITLHYTCVHTCR